MKTSLKIENVVNTTILQKQDSGFRQFALL